MSDQVGNQNVGFLMMRLKCKCWHGRMCICTIHLPSFTLWDVELIGKKIDDGAVYALVSQNLNTEQHQQNNPFVGFIYFAAESKGSAKILVG